MVNFQSIFFRKYRLYFIFSIYVTEEIIFWKRIGLNTFWIKEVEKNVEIIAVLTICAMTLDFRRSHSARCQD